jgi:hypothetical protein
MHKEDGEEKRRKSKTRKRKNLCRGEKQLSPNVVGGTNGGPNLSVDTHLPPMCERAEEKIKPGTWNPRARISGLAR